MATLTVGGWSIPLAQDGLAVSYEETGTRERMFSASMLETVRARKQIVTGRTTLVTRTAAETYMTALRASPPMICSGDAFNNVSTSCFAKVDSLTPVQTASGLKWRLTFTLFEA